MLLQQEQHQKEVELPHAARKRKVSICDPDESVFALYRRLDSRPFPTELNVIDEAGLGYSERRGRRGLLPGDVYEIYGSSGSGKTELLLNAVVKFALSRKVNGAGKYAYFFDLDCRLPIQRLAAIARARVQACEAFRNGVLLPLDDKNGYRGSKKDINQKGIDTDQGQIVEAYVRDCLARIRVLRPRGPLELTAAFTLLHQSLRGELALVALDGLGSAAGPAAAAAAAAARGVGPGAALGSAWARALRRGALGRRRVAVLAAKPAPPGAFKIPGANKGDNSNNCFSVPSHREYLPPEWQGQVNIRILLQKTNVFSNASGEMVTQISARMMQTIHQLNNSSNKDSCVTEDHSNRPSVPVTREGSFIITDRGIFNNNPF